jgi:hypothetical protein
MSFKTKIKKKNVNGSRITIEAKHKEILEQFSENIRQAKANTGVIADYKEKINSIGDESLDDEGVETKLHLMDQITKLEHEINEIKNEDVHYLLDNGNLLFDYYKNSNNISDGKKSKINNIKKLNGSNQKSVMEYFSNTIHTEDAVTDTDSKDYICNEYFFNTDNNFIKPVNNKNIDLCTTCHIERTLYLSEGKTICHTCGDENSILIDSDKPSYKDPPREVTYFSYKRINHFNEWLAQFQAKETTDIPQEVYDEILCELKKERVREMNNLQPAKIREILKKLKKNKYYEHVPHIINKMNGISPPVITRETEETMRRMFKEIQIPFHKFCPKDRKNFLSYSYVLHKFVELLELDEFIQCFMLLKSREKLHQQDQIWKQICNYLNWQFIPCL